MIFAAIWEGRQALLDGGTASLTVLVGPLRTLGSGAVTWPVLTEDCDCAAGSVDMKIIGLAL